MKFLKELFKVIGGVILAICVLAGILALLTSLPEKTYSSVIGLIPLAIGIFIYFIPSISAKMRKHPKIESIVAVNLFLGWTLIGWVISLVWAMTEPVKR